MKVLEGKSVFSGIAIGKISILQKADTSVKRTKVENPEAEITRVQEAKEKAVEQLQKLYDKALREVGESGAAIFEVHQMMLDDEDYLDSIDNIIRTENVNAEYAVATTGDNFADMFAQMDDDYMKARAADVKDISDRLVRVLSGHDEGDMDAAEPSIIVAEDLAPSETVQMDKSKVLAFVTRKGSSNSHTAILARTMNIPALINIEYDDSMDGKMAVVDGKTGSLIVEPDADTLKKYQNQKDEELRQRAMLKELKGKTTETKSGHKIHLYANIGSTGDVASVLANDAEGIGLFRSEFIYLEKDNYCGLPESHHQSLQYHPECRSAPPFPILLLLSPPVGISYSSAASLYLHLTIKRIVPCPGIQHFTSGFFHYRVSDIYSRYLNNADDTAFFKNGFLLFTNGGLLFLNL